MKNKEKVVCVICELNCKKNPEYSNEYWSKVRYSEGIHYECADSFSKEVKRLQNQIKYMYEPANEQLRKTISLQSSELRIAETLLTSVKDKLEKTRNEINILSAGSPDNEVFYFTQGKHCLANDIEKILNTEL